MDKKKFSKFSKIIFKFGKIVIFALINTAGNVYFI